MSDALPLVNTHIHLPPNFSSFDTVDETIEQAAAEGIRILGTSNYYDFSVYEPFAKKARARGIEPLFGIEIVCRIASLAEQGIRINDPANPGKMYLCGKGLRRVDDPTPRAQMLLAIIRTGDEARMTEMVCRLVRIFCESGIESHLDYEEIARTVAARHAVPVDSVVLQERHVARSFQELLFERIPLSERAERLTRLFRNQSKVRPEDPVGVQAEIRTYLMKAGRPAFVDENFVTFEEARELILELGGIVCYPLLADGANPVPEFEAEPAEFVKRLLDLGIDSAEFITNRNSPGTVSEYVEQLHRSGFSVSAGTEHNTNERIALAPCCKGGAEIPPEVRGLFIQGAMHQCAHQHAREAVA